LFWLKSTLNPPNPTLTLKIYTFLKPFKLKIQNSKMLPSCKKLKNIFNNETDAVAFSSENNLIFQVASCPNDGYSMTSITPTRFKCRKKKCRKIFSALTGSVFNNQYLLISEFLHVVF
jgi:hypothetical protein